jgi:hypothetical protein
MRDLFPCPECHAVHSEPLSPAFVLAVTCAACELSDELDAALALSASALRPAA